MLLIRGFYFEREVKGIPGCVCLGGGHTLPIPLVLHVRKCIEVDAHSLL